MDMKQYRKQKTKKMQKKSKQESSFKRKIFFFFSRVFVTIILFLLCLIVCKSDTGLKNQIYKYVYNSNLSFTKFHKIYDKYLGKAFFFDSLSSKKEKAVFQEKLSYEEKSIYKDGVKLKVSDSYLVPLLESGIVVYIGQKDPYNRTVIIQQINGVDVWYGNIKNETVKLYDYVEKGKVLGEADGNYLYMVFAKKGKFLSYKDYI